MLNKLIEAVTDIRELAHYLILSLILSIFYHLVLNPTIPFNNAIINTIEAFIILVVVDIVLHVYLIGEK